MSGFLKCPRLPKNAATVSRGGTRATPSAEKEHNAGVFQRMSELNSRVVIGLPLAETSPGSLVLLRVRF